MQGMRYRSFVSSLSLGMLMLAGLTGCAGRERAVVNLSYVVEPTRGLPPGVRTITIMPAVVGPSTDPKWSDMCVTILQSLVNESRNQFNTPVDVSERRDARAVFDESDLAAAGMSNRRGGAPGQLLGAEASIVSNINVKVTIDRGAQRTISGLALMGGGGHGYGVGGGDVQTEEVETVQRNMTVQTEFKLVDLGNGRVWEHFSPSPYRSTERTKASPIFGSSQTEAALTPTDQIVATLVERGAREFISRLMPCRIEAEVEVESSGNKNCVQGVRLLRAESYEEALSYFQSALQEDPNDHRAAFGAGVGCEALGRYDGAVKYYQQALVGQDSGKYRDARERMKAYSARARK